MMRTSGYPSRLLFILAVAVATPGVLFAADESSSVKLLVGRSAVVDVGTPISRVSLTSSDVADAMVTASNQLLVNGKMPGTISMFVWERTGAIKRYEIVVQRDLARLNDQMKQLFPGETIDAQSNGKAIVLSGQVSSKETLAKASSVAAGYVEKADDVVNLLRLQEGIRTNQVLLRVRFAEVSRSAMTELGASLFTSPTGVKNTLARTTTEQFSAPGFDQLNYTKANGNFGSPVTSADGKFTFSDFLNLFLFSEKYDIGAMVRALSTRGLFQSLAEPNLVAESGKEASFLAGGEIPIPIAQGTGGNVAISVQFKEFGIRLNFTPIVSGSRVHLKVRPEVSTLDFSNAIVMQGFRIPALSTRRTETELELNDGQTFAIAGLLNNTLNSTLQKIPGIGDIPILGLLFKSKAAQKNQTELVVMITPQILSGTSPGVTPNLPRQVEPYLPAVPQKKTFDAPPPAFSGATAAASNSPAAAAAAVSALMPSGPTPINAAPAPAAAVAPPQTLPAVPLAAAPTQPAAPAAASKAAPVDAKARAKEEEAARRAAKLEKARLAKEKEQQEKVAHEQEQAAREQAKRDKEQAKRDKEQAKKDAEAAAAAAAEAKRLGEIEKKHQKALDEAAARAKEAEARYQALAKSQKQE
jgi:pilus assembly protein CpaC